MRFLLEVFVTAVFLAMMKHGEALSELEKLKTNQLPPIKELPPPIIVEDLSDVIDIGTDADPAMSIQGPPLLSLAKQELIPLKLVNRPTFQDKQRIYLCVTMLIEVSQVPSQKSVTHLVTTLAEHVFQSWALGFQGPADAFNNRAIRKLREALFQLNPVITPATIRVVSIQIGEKKKPAYESDQFMKHENKLTRIHNDKLRSQRRSPQLWAKPETAADLEDLFEQQKTKIKDPEEPFI